MSRRNSKTTPEALAAQGLVEYAPGCFAKASNLIVAALREPVPAPAPPAARQWAPYRNKTEWRFAAWLAQHYPAPGGVTYESAKFCIGAIGGRQSWYMPDFIVTTSETVKVFEVKGQHRFREKGIERLRNAAARFPRWEWWLAEPNASGGWSLKRVEG